MFKAKIIVKLKKDVSDPQGIAIKGALEHLNFKGIENISVGKYFDAEIDAADFKKAEELVNKISHDLLSNPVIEDYTFTLEELK